MMNLSDLRINNFYYLGEDFLFQLDKKSFIEIITGGEEHLNNLRTVPIDDSWLTKRFLFRKNSIEYYKSIELDETHIFSIAYSDNGYFYETRTLTRKLEFVHEIQNLFYDLTKLEVTEL